MKIVHRRDKNCGYSSWEFFCAPQKKAISVLVRHCTTCFWLQWQWNKSACVLGGEGGFNISSWAPFFCAPGCSGGSRRCLPRAAPPGCCFVPPSSACQRAIAMPTSPVKHFEDYWCCSKAFIWAFDSNISSFHGMFYSGWTAIHFPCS